MPDPDHLRALIVETLEQAGWIVGGPRGAAAKLGLKRTTLLAKMRRMGISRPIDQEGTDARGVGRMLRFESVTAVPLWSRMGRSVEQIGQLIPQQAIAQHPTRL